MVRRATASSSRSDVDLTGIEVDPLTALIYEAPQKAGDEGVQFGYNVDVIAPPEFNDAMLTGFQAILAGDKTAEEQAADAAGGLGGRPGGGRGSRRPNAEPG